MEQEKALMTAREVSELLGCKMCMAYKIIRECNENLKAAGKIVIRGRVNRKYLLKRLEIEEV